MDEVGTDYAKFSFSINKCGFVHIVGLVIPLSNNYTGTSLSVAEIDDDRNDHD